MHLKLVPKDNDTGVAAPQTPQVSLVDRLVLARNQVEVANAVSAALLNQVSDAELGAAFVARAVMLGAESSATTFGHATNPIHRGFFHPETRLEGASGEAAYRIDTPTLCTGNLVAAFRHLTIAHDTKRPDILAKLLPQVAFQATVGTGGSQRPGDSKKSAPVFGQLMSLLGFDVSTIAANCRMPLETVVPHTFVVSHGAGGKLTIFDPSRPTLWTYLNGITVATPSAWGIPSDQREQFLRGGEVIVMLSDRLQKKEGGRTTYQVSPKGFALYQWPAQN